MIFSMIVKSIVRAVNELIQRNLENVRTATTCPRSPCFPQNIPGSYCTDYPRAVAKIYEPKDCEYTSLIITIMFFYGTVDRLNEISSDIIEQTDLRMKSFFLFTAPFGNTLQLPNYLNQVYQNRFIIQGVIKGWANTLSTTLENKCSPL